MTPLQKAWLVFVSGIALGLLLVLSMDTWPRIARLEQRIAAIEPTRAQSSTEPSPQVRPQRLILQPGVGSRFQ
jgi:hypothetical protein